VQPAGKVSLDCVDAADLAGDPDWWRIYEDSFPPAEREPAEVVLRSLRASVGLAFRAHQDGVTVGIATTHLLLRPAAVFLVYLALDRARRNAGLGGTLLEYAWQTSARRLEEQHSPPLGLVWEVDDPTAAVGQAEDLLREGRIAFFRRHGGVELPRPYRQPPVNGTETVPMRLMFRGSAVPDALGIEALVRAIYFEKYGAVNQVPEEILQDLLYGSA
jgi:hypothetical protein